MQLGDEVSTMVCRHLFAKLKLAGSPSAFSPSATATACKESPSECNAELTQFKAVGDMTPRASMKS